MMNYGDKAARNKTSNASDTGKQSKIEGFGGGSKPVTHNCDMSEKSPKAPIKGFSDTLKQGKV